MSIELFGLEIFIFVILLAFFSELLDSTLGMGYGTTLTPILMLFGFGALAIVPCVLLSELITGISAGMVHHKIGNVSFKRGSVHLKIAIVLATCSIIGATLAVFIAISLPKFWLNLYIGLMVLMMGIIILLALNKNFRFSWKKIVGLGSIAAFNKGMSGGGYGPVVTGGQILSGVNGNNAVGITSLAEGLTCIVGVIVYIISPEIINWSLAPSLIIGALLSVPFSAFIVKNIPTKALKVAIGTLTIILGVITLIKVINF
ncbi:MAG: hypothetical protein AYK22_02390 [Thermoplasmatales archaeon SG8-52-3]|nr:MAG: hypothetical protein AYK22_02390 [Thermoplasmatales archaeon SG8-52-3]